MSIRAIIGLYGLNITLLVATIDLWTIYEPLVGFQIKRLIPSYVASGFYRVAINRVPRIA
jgi:hypothetical protein